MARVMKGTGPSGSGLSAVSMEARKPMIGWSHRASLVTEAERETGRKRRPCGANVEKCRGQPLLCPQTSKHQLHSTHGYGSKLNHQGTTNVSLCFHLLGCHFGYSHIVTFTENHQAKGKKAISLLQPEGEICGDCCPW